jgi:hypothetical protein
MKWGGSGLAHTVERVRLVGRGTRGSGGGGSSSMWAVRGECGPTEGEGKWAGPRIQRNL